MDKFPLLCTVSALIVLLGAAIGAAGVQTTGTSKDLPFGINSVEQIQTSAIWNRDVSMALSQDLSEVGRLVASPEVLSVSNAKTSVPIRGEILVSF